MSLELGRRFPATNGSVRAYVAPLRDDLVRNVRLSVLLMQGAVAFVLLIACVNLAHLMLVRSLSRSKEIAVRVALGAGRARVVREVLAEALVLAFLGATLGIGFGQATLRLFVTLAPARARRGSTARRSTRARCCSASAWPC